MTDPDNLQLAVYADDGSPATWTPSQTPHLLLAPSTHPHSVHRGMNADDVAFALFRQAHQAGWELTLLTPHGQDLEGSRPHLTRQGTYVAWTGSGMRAGVETVHSEMMRRYEQVDNDPTTASSQDFPPIMLSIGDVEGALATMGRNGEMGTADDAPSARVQEQLSRIIHLGRAARIHLVLVGELDAFMSWFSGTDRDNIRARVVLGDPCDKEIQAAFGLDATASHRGSSHLGGVADLGNGPRMVRPHVHLDGMAMSKKTSAFHRSTNETHEA